MTAITSISAVNSGVPDQRQQPDFKPIRDRDCGRRFLRVGYGLVDGLRDPEPLRKLIQQLTA